MRTAKNWFVYTWVFFSNHQAQHLWPPFDVHAQTGLICTPREDIFANAAEAYLFWWFLYAAWLLSIGVNSPRCGYVPRLVQPTRGETNIKGFVEGGPEHRHGA